MINYVKLHVNHGGINKSPNKLSAAKIKLTRWFVNEREKPLTREKPPTKWFQITTPKNPLIKNQMVTSIRNLTTTLDFPKIPTYSWTFTPIPNWTWSCRDYFLYVWIPVRVWFPSNSLFVVRCKVVHFKTHWRSGSTWL